jgi:hypothetical protein
LVGQPLLAPKIILAMKIGNFGTGFAFGHLSWKKNTRTQTVTGILSTFAERWCQHFDGPTIWNPCHVKIWGMNLPNLTLCISVPVFVAHRLIDHLFFLNPSLLMDQTPCMMLEPHSRRWKDMCPWLQIWFTVS